MMDGKMDSFGLSWCHTDVSFCYYYYFLVANGRFLCFATAGLGHEALLPTTAQANDIYHNQLTRFATSEWVSKTLPLYSLNIIK